jgi:hypothetical protein
MPKMVKKMLMTLRTKAKKKKRKKKKKNQKISCLSYEKVCL